MILYQVNTLIISKNSILKNLINKIQINFNYYHDYFLGTPLVIKNIPNNVIITISDFYAACLIIKEKNDLVISKFDYMLLI